MNYPVRKVYITQEWGVNPSTYASLGLKGHNGIDLRIFDNNGVKAISGDLIAPHDGIIIEAGSDPDGYGLYYKIENDIEGSILAHNKELLCKVGDSVKEGQLIGYTDNTGWSTGSHCHWGYYRKPRDKSNGYSGTCDPKPYIKPVEIIQDSMAENDLQVVLDYYHVKTKDELIKMVDEQLKFLADARSSNESLKSQLAVKEESYSVEKEKHQKLIEFIISKISPLISFVDNSEEAARQAILDLISKQDTLAKEIKDTKDQAEKKEQELVKKNETLQGQLDVLQKQFDTLRKKYDQDIETMQDRIDSVQAQLEENNDAKEENGKFLTWIKNLIEKITKG